MARGKLVRVYSSKKKVPEKTKRYVSRRIARVGEMKHYEINPSTLLETTNGTTTVALSGIAQGDTDENREGVRIDARSLHVNYYLSPDTANVTGDRVRVIVWQFKGNSADLDPTGAGNTDGILFESGTNSVTRIISNFKKDVKDFRILWDRTHALPTYANAGCSGKDEQIQRVKIYSKKLLNQLRYNSGASTGENMIYLSYLGIAAAGGNASTNINYNSQLNFKDL